MRHPLLPLVSLVTALALPGLFAPAASAAAAKQAVYVELADSLQGSLDELGTSLRAAFTSGGWEVVAVHDVPTDRATCPYHARVLVLNAPAHTRQVLLHGPHAAFAIPVRLLLVQDETGTHLATVNPLSIDRTIVAETGFETASEGLLRDLTRISATAVRGHFVPRAYGQVRDRGLIGRTMGVMAGGPFEEKLKVVWSGPGTSAADVAALGRRLWDGMERSGGHGKWQLRPIYRIDLSEQGVVVIGVSGDAMETKSYAIVGAGNDDARAHGRCAGLAHAAAYPIEIVVGREAGGLRVTVVDGMYRMKMFFEDAGKMKFAANMGMPGSIEDEMRALVTAALSPKP